MCFNSKLENNSNFRFFNNTVGKNYINKKFDF